MEKFRFKRFRVYQDAKIFCSLVNKIIKNNIINNEPKLANQIFRATISIVLNIAEGSGSSSDIEFARYITISIKSAYEVVAGFDIALQLNLIEIQDSKLIENKVLELVKQLSAFKKKLKSNG